VPVDLVTNVFALPRTSELINCEIVIERQKISIFRTANCDSERLASDDTDDLPTLDLDNGIVLPRFVDIHTHLDRAYTSGRSRNPDGTFIGAAAAAMADMQQWNARDIYSRMDFSLRCAFAHGTGAIRTHLDWAGKPLGASWSIFQELREHWKAKITLQAVALFPIEMAVEDTGQFHRIVDTVVKCNGVLGGVTGLADAPGPKLELALDRLFEAAVVNDLDLDLHVDEHLRAYDYSVEQVLLAARRHKFKGKLVIGHCCALSVVADPLRDRIITLLSDTNCSVVCLPLSNLYLQDRVPGRTPRLRGVAPVHELDNASIRVMIGSDNVHDSFYPYGDFDMLEVYRAATRILHFDHSKRPWIRTLGMSAGEIMGIEAQGRIAAGQPADLVITTARTIPDLLSRPQSDRTVLVGGRAIDTTLPDYRELD
jgi:cytosine deaminase